MEIKIWKLPIFNTHDSCIECKEIKAINGDRIYYERYGKIVMNNDFVGEDMYKILGRNKIVILFFFSLFFFGKV